MYLVDTNVVSEARRRTPAAVAWLRAAQSDSLFLSAITIGEIQKGITLKARTDPHQAAALLRWLDELRFFYSGRILPVNDAVAVNWGRLMVERTRPVADTLITATARTFNKVVVTRNVADFAGTGVDVIDPWAVAG
jgi:predicted nucleic acid-binding protein